MCKFAIATKCLIINEDNKYLILEKTQNEAKYDKCKNLYDLPGGRLLYKEDITDCVIREVFEETNIKITKDNIKNILDAKSIVREDGLHLVVITYIVKVKCTNIKISNEHSNFYWIDESFENLPNWILETINSYKA